MTEQHKPDVVQQQRESSGLFEGFEQFSTPTDDEYRSVMTGGLVVRDANAVLIAQGQCSARRLQASADPLEEEI